jgi:hypothetical protein
MTISSPSDPGGSQEPQEALFDDEPKANSPEDLGQAVPAARRYGKPRPEPEPLPKNLSPAAIDWKDFRKFVAWVHEEEFPIHADVTVGHCMTTLSGLGLEDLRWLCQAIRQAGRAPCPVTMRKAALARDVRIMRPGDQAGIWMKVRK